MRCRLVSGSALAAFRILWGLVLAYECLAYLFRKSVLKGLTSEHFHFQFYGFEWIPMQSYEGLRVLMYVLLGASLSIAAGLLTRFSLLVFSIGFTYLWLMEMANYLNHFYLVSVITILCAFLPLNCAYALDNLIFRSSRQVVIPSWTYSILRWEVSIVYFYASLAKVNVDWLYVVAHFMLISIATFVWLAAARGEPLRHWLTTSARLRLPFFGRLFQLELGCYLFSYAGLFFDLFAPVLLSYRRLRPLGMLLSATFHLSNKLIFNIGIFPAAMCALTSLFLPEDWPEQMWGILLIGLRKTRRSGRIIQKPAAKTPEMLRSTTTTVHVSRLTQVLIAAFLLVNIVMPLRHYTYPGDVTWHEHGHRFSWRMKLRDKECDGAYILLDPVTNLTTRGDMDFLSERQQSKMWARPEMVVQYAHFLADEAVRTGQTRPQVFANVECSLNYRPWQQFITPSHDLAAHGVWDWPYPFVTQLKPLTPELEAQLLWRLLLNDPWALLGPTRIGAFDGHRMEASPVTVDPPAVDVMCESADKLQDVHA